MNGLVETAQQPEYGKQLETYADSTRAGNQSRDGITIGAARPYPQPLQSVPRPWDSRAEP